MFQFVAFTALLATAFALPAPYLDGRIVGGEDAYIEDHPYQLSLQIYGNHFCGASIISSKWAVTAAHCTNGKTASQLTAVAGISNLKENGQRVAIAKIHQDPEYVVTTFFHDITVLELASAITLNANAQPVALASDGHDPAPGTSVLVSGWGTLYSGGYISEQLQKVTVQIINRSSCSDSYGTTITPDQLCAGVPQGGKDACQGDSGGPIVAGGKLVGIVSWGYGCAEARYPGVYANVGALRSYIKKIAGI